MADIPKKYGQVHDLVHDFAMKAKRRYTEPKIYSGGVKLSDWSRLSRKQKEEALKKDWYIWYSYRDQTGKLKRLPNIKAYANTYHTKEERIAILEPLRKSLLELLERGMNPFNARQYDGELVENQEMDVGAAFDYVLAKKKVTQTHTSHSNYKGRLERFRKWLFDNGFENRFITSVNQFTVNKYLTQILLRTSAANYNNTRLDLSSFFGALAKENIITENFVLKIGKEDSKSKKNRTYSTDQESEIFEYMERHDPQLLLFVKFVSYAFLRPVEVCRLTVEDTRIKDRTFVLKTKTEAVKTKIIPEILLNELPDLSPYNRTDYLFTPWGIGQWELAEDDKRHYFGKRFLKVKKALKLGKEYGMYSFRHTFITRLYNQMIKDKTPDEAESYVMLITGHTTRQALRKYLKDIDAYRPEDFSKHLR